MFVQIYSFDIEILDSIIKNLLEKSDERRFELIEECPAAKLFTFRYLYAAIKIPE